MVGSIVTMDPYAPRAQAMATSRGRIVALGSVEDVRRSVPSGTPTVDLGNASVLPGLIDCHNHMLWTGMAARRLDLADARSIPELLDHVAVVARRTPGDDWLLGSEGWDIADLAERRYPTRQELDGVVGYRPVFLPRAGHAGVLNSEGLRRCGIDPQTEDPPGGSVERDAHGRPTGLVLEAARQLVEPYLPATSAEDRRAALLEVQQRYLPLGLTRVLEPGLDSADLSAYQDLHTAGDLRVRVTAMPQVGGRDLDQRLASWDCTGVRTGFGDDRLRLGGLKTYLDGGGSLGTALMREPWPGRGDYRGDQVLSEEELTTVVRFCAERRWSFGVHAVGGAAIDLAIEVFERVHQRTPIDDLRFQLIHAYLWPSDANFRAARRLGLVLAAQPSMQERFAEAIQARLGLDALARAGPLRAWLDSGVRVGGGSDSPITPASPMHGIWQATTRHHHATGEPLGPDQRLGRIEALDLYTRGAAYVCGEDHQSGTLRVGALADWTAWTFDPRTVPADELANARPLLTVVGGSVEHDAR